MNIVKVQGGLGNQLFQWAFGQYLNSKHHSRLYYDTSWYNHLSSDISRSFVLNQLLKEPPVMMSDHTLGGSLIKLGLRAPHLVRKALKSARILQVFKDLSYPSFDSKAFCNYYEGFWQNYVFVDQVSLENIDLGRIRNNISKKINHLSQPNTVSIHLRRGDYLAKKHKSVHGLLPISYYNKAISLVSAKIHKPIFLLFSDSPEILAKLQISKSITISGKGFSEVEELAIMASCDHQIIANSTFSWWAAYLNQNPKKLVVAPSIWSHQGVISQAILPPTWIQISTELE